MTVNAKLSSKGLPSTPPQSCSRKSLNTGVVKIMLTGMLLAAGSAAYADAIALPNQSPAYSDLVNYGAYVARAGDCMACHGENYAGGLPISTPMGDIVATNITPSIEYGIGRYTEDDLKIAIRQGRMPTHMLYPAMPYPSYNKMGDEDIHALFAYMQTVPAVDEPLETKTNLDFPFNMRSLMHFWNVINIPKWSAGEGLTQQQRRGQYLVDNVEHCNDCHTPRNATMGLDLSKYLSQPNITPDVETGIGSWGEGDIVTFLRTGVLEGRAFAGGPMGEVVAHSTQYLSDADLKAMASYLKVVPAIRTDNLVHPVNEAAYPPKHSEDITFNLLKQIDVLKQAKASASSETEHLYLDNCASCHGVNGYGQTEASYPAIVGLTTTRQDKPNHLIDVIANGLEGATNTKPSMPGFKDDLTAEQITEITNYTRVTFGGLEQSSIDANAVKAALSEDDTPFLIKNARWLSILGIIVGLLLLAWLIRWLMTRNRRPVVDQRASKHQPKTTKIVEDVPPRDHK